MGMATMIITTVVLIALFVAALRAYLIRKKKRYLMSKYTDDHEVELIMKKHVWRGMSEEQLLNSLGRPTAKSQDVQKYKITETFKYNRMGKNRFKVRVRVANGTVVGWTEN